MCRGVVSDKLNIYSHALKNIDKKASETLNNLLG